MLHVNLFVANFLFYKWWGAINVMPMLVVV